MERDIASLKTPLSPFAAPFLPKDGPPPLVLDAPSSNSFVCPFCDSVSPTSKVVIEHMLHTHHVVVHEPNVIARMDRQVLLCCPNMHRYFRFWKEELQGDSPKGLGPGSKYKEDIDRNVRARLHRERLIQLLTEQQKERQNTEIERQCLLCNAVLKGRDPYFHHLYTIHHTHFGHPDNIVHFERFLDLLEERLKAGCCFYCGVHIDTPRALRAHMKKKRHLKLHPEDHAFDEFYMLNYLEPGMCWQTLRADGPSLEEEEEEDSEATWEEDEEDIEAMELATCLFACGVDPAHPLDILKHMAQAHDWDLLKMVREWSLEEHQVIVLVNYIRRQVVLHRCPTCNSIVDDVAGHVEEIKHGHVQQEDAFWKEPQYLLPTMDMDGLLAFDVVHAAQVE